MGAYPCPGPPTPRPLVLPNQEATLHCLKQREGSQTQKLLFLKGCFFRAIFGFLQEF